MIEVKNLTKRFGPKVAVDNIAFEVRKGEVLGFLGPNGAGKSTTMRMITGFIPPTEGSITIAGVSLFDDEIGAKSKIGYLPESAPLYNDMSVRDFLAYSAEIRGLDGSAKSKAIDHVVELCFLQPVFHQSIDTLSKGFRHRTCLAQSLIHDPPILILDEPTDGLDPNQKHEIRSLLKRLGETKAIIFSTHILEEVEAVCSRAIIIDRGKVIANGTPAELKARSADAGAIVLRARGKGTDGLRDGIMRIKEADSVDVLESKDDFLALRIHPKAKSNGALSPAVFQLCVEKSLTVEELSVEQGQLDDVFRSLTTTDVSKA